MLQCFAVQVLLGNYQREYQQKCKKSLLEALLCCIMVGKFCSARPLIYHFFCLGIHAPVT